MRKEAEVHGTIARKKQVNDHEILELVQVRTIQGGQLEQVTGPGTERGSFHHF